MKIPVTAALVIVLSAGLVFGGFVPVAEVPPMDERPAAPKEFEALVPDDDLHETLERLSDRDLQLITGTGWFKDLSCAVLAGISGGGAIVALGAKLAAVTIPPLGAGIIIGAGLASFVCYLL